MPTVLSTTELVYQYITHIIYCAFHVPGAVSDRIRGFGADSPISIPPARIGGDAVDVGPVDERNGNGID